MGFIGIDRRLRDHWIYQDAEYLKVWLEMMFLARFAKDSGKVMVEGQLIEMEYSWFIYGRIKWSERLGISERRLRTLMDKLVNDQMISLVKRAPKFSIYCVTNFDKYRPTNDQQDSLEQQGIEAYDDQQNDQQATSRRPASDQQATTKEQGINKVNKVNKVKEEVIKEIYAEKVSLSIPEYEKLIIKYGNEENVKWGIEKLSNYKCSKKTKYTSDYHVLIGWVFEDFEKRKLTVLKGGQADAATTESRGKPNFSQYPSTNQQTPKAAGQNEPVRRGVSLNSEYDLDQFIRG